MSSQTGADLIRRGEQVMAEARLICRETAEVIRQLRHTVAAARATRGRNREAGRRPDRLVPPLG
jgi:hypothetical protein